TCSRLLYFPLACISPLPRSCTIFPYTTLFRSNWNHGEHGFHWHVVCKLTWVALVVFPTAICHDDPQHQDPGDDTNDKCSYPGTRSEEHTSELQSRFDLVCRLLLEKKKQNDIEP